MQSKYGNLYKVTEFISRLIPKKAVITENAQNYINTVINFLKELDNIQENNSSITLSIHSSDGIYIYHNLEHQFFIKPTQKHILLHIFENNKLLKKN